MTDKQPTAEERARKIVSQMRDGGLGLTAAWDWVCTELCEAEQAARRDEREKCVLKFEQLWPGHSVTAAKLRALGSGDEE